MRTCCVCHVAKELTEFYAWKRSADKLTYDCKDCVRKRQRSYYHRPERRVVEKAYRKRYEKLPHVVAKRMTPEAKAAGKIRRATWTSNPSGRAVEMLGAVRGRSVLKGYDFDLDVSDIYPILISGKCEITGIPFEFTRAKGNKMGPWSPSIDRIDSRKGYIKGNIQVVVWALNAARNSWGDEVLNTLVQALSKREQLPPQDPGLLSFRGKASLQRQPAPLQESGCDASRLFQ